MKTIYLQRICVHVGTSLGESARLCWPVIAGHLCNMFQTLMWWFNEMHYDLMNVMRIYAILEAKEKFKA